MSESELRRRYADIRKRLYGTNISVKAIKKKKIIQPEKVNWRTAVTVSLQQSDHGRLVSTLCIIKSLMDEKVSLTFIREVVAFHWLVTQQELASYPPMRWKRLTTARAYGMCISRLMVPCSYVRIASMWGVQDHTSVRYATMKHHNEVLTVMNELGMKPLTVWLQPSDR